MTNKTLPTLTAASAIADADLLLTRISGQTEDQKLSASKLLTYVTAGMPAVTVPNIVNDGKQISGAGNISAGSTTFTDTTNSPFTSADTGKLFCINAAGDGSFGTARGDNPTSITAIASVSSTTRVTFVLNTGAGTPVDGIAYYIKNGGTNGVATIGSTTYYLKTVTNTSGSTYTALLYTSPNLTGNVAFPGLGTGTGQGFFGPVQLVATGTYVSATTMTLSVAAGVNISNAVNVDYAYGTDNTTAINNAISALPSQGGIVQIPAGKFMVNATAQSNAITVTKSNVTIAGAGVGATTIMKGDWFGIIFVGMTSGSNVSNIVFRDMSLTFSIPVATRFNTSFYSFAAAFVGASSNTISNSAFINIEHYGTCLGLANSGGTTNCYGLNCYGHEVLANIFSNVNANSSVGPQDCGWINCYGANSGDSTFADDNVNGSVAARDTFWINCKSYNSGNYGWEVIGVNGFTIIGGETRKAFGGAIKIDPGYTGNTVKNGVIVGHKCWGAGTGSHQYGNNTNVYPGGYIFSNSQTAGNGSITNVQIIGCVSGPDGSNKNVGPYIGSVSAGGAISGITVTGFKGFGGQTANPGSGGQNAYGANAGIDWNNVSGGITMGETYLDTTYGDGVLVAATCTGSVNLGDILVNAPNSSAAGSKYALNILGGQCPTRGKIIMTGASTIAGKINYAPASTFTIANTFSSAGGFSAASLNGQSGTGTGALAWTVGTGTINVTLGGSNSITTASGTSIAYINPARSDVDVSVTLGVAPTAVNQCFILINYDGTNAIILDAFNMKVIVGAGGNTQTGNIVTAPLAGDTIRIIRSGNSLVTYNTHSATTTLVGEYWIPELGGVGNGTLCGVEFLSTTPTVTAFNVV